MITPVELRDGRFYKRDDLNAHPSGVNGGKWRQCQWLIGRMRGDIVITGASVLSPQHAMTAVAARELGKLSIHVVGGTTRKHALHHPSPALAHRHGGHFRVLAVGYNPVLQSEVRRLAEKLAGEVLEYGVAPALDASTEQLHEFHELGAAQTANLPGGLRTLIVPFGSGNSAASILLGLARHPEPPAEVHMVGIGPNRQEWLGKRLWRLGLRRFPQMRLIFYNTGIPYSSRVRYEADGITLHPTYEGKVARWADETQPPGWVDRDKSCAFWIVGAAL